MVIKQIAEIYELLDDPCASGESIRRYFQNIDPEADVTVTTVTGSKGSTDEVRLLIPGTEGKSAKGSCPTIEILGRLGGIGARPDLLGMVSDGDGALTALTVGAKLLSMKVKGDRLKGDVYVATHICPNCPTSPHKPIPFMGSPISMNQCNESEVIKEADAILSIDTTKGNRVINHRGFAISNTVKEGYILPVSSDLLSIMEITTGMDPYVFPLSTQDITPYGNGLSHLNSILQPAWSTDAPVVGVAITTQTAVPGCATNASHVEDIAEAAAFALQTAIDFTKGSCQFYDKAEFADLVKRYGTMKQLQGYGALPPADAED